MKLKKKTRAGNNNWCQCGGYCQPMDTDTESLCCRDTNEIPDDILKASFINALTC